MEVLVVHKRLIISRIIGHIIGIIGCVINSISTH